MVFQAVPPLRDDTELTRFLPFGAGGRIVRQIPTADGCSATRCRWSAALVIFGGLTACRWSSAWCCSTAATPEDV